MEWSITTDCKSVGRTAFAGSNPAAPTVRLQSRRTRSGSKWIYPFTSGFECRSVVIVCGQLPRGLPRKPEATAEGYSREYPAASLEYYISDLFADNSYAVVAQLVEHFHGKEGVPGSNPGNGSVR